MTRKGPSKKVDASFAAGRLRNARDHLEAAKAELSRIEEGGNANPAMLLMVTSAIAFADAITASRGGAINQKDHAAVLQLLRDTLEDELPKKQESNLRAILLRKQEVQYGATYGRSETARSMMAALEEFAAWATRTVSAR